MNTHTTAHVVDEDPEAAYDFHIDSLFTWFPDADVIQSKTFTVTHTFYLIETEFK